MEHVETATRGLLGHVGFLPPWLVSAAMFAIAIAGAYLAHRTAFAIVTRIVAGWDLFWRSLVSRTHGPTRFAAMTLALGFAAGVSPLTPGQGALIRHALLLCFVVLIGWIARTALHIWTTVYLRRFKLDADDNLLARKHVTQTRILQRIGDVMIVIVTVSALLMTVDGVRQYGVSLLASAGAAGLVAGLALQPVLKNIFAGIQLAVTQPIRIDDALLCQRLAAQLREERRPARDLDQLVHPADARDERPVPLLEEHARAAREPCRLRPDGVQAGRELRREGFGARLTADDAAEDADGGENLLDGALVEGEDGVAAAHELGREIGLQV